MSSILQQLDPSAGQKADGANNLLLLRPTVHSKGPSWHASALSEFVQCPQPAGRGLSPVCVVCGAGSTAAHPIVYLTEFILSVLWEAHNGESHHRSILPRRKEIQRAVVLSLHTKKRGTWSLRSSSLFAWPGGSRCGFSLRLVTVGQCG